METKSELAYLVEEFKNDNEESFTALMNYTKEDIYRVIYAIVQNQENALDVMQDVIYKAYVNLKNLKNNNFFKTWLTRIAINEAKNYLRKNSKVIYIEDYGKNETVGSYKSEMQEERMDIEIALKKLDVNTKSVLVLKLYNEYTFETIAEVLSKPVSTIKSTYYTGLEKLKQVLKVEEVNIDEQQ